MFTGKNKEQFKEWIEDYSEKSQCKLIEDRDIYPDEIFYQLPFEMQLGVYLAYADSLGYCVYVDFDYREHVMKFDYTITKEAIVCEKYDFNNLQEAYKEAFKEFDRLINNQK